MTSSQQTPIASSLKPDGHGDFFISAQTPSPQDTTQRDHVGFSSPIRVDGEGLILFRERYKGLEIEQASGPKGVCYESSPFPFDVETSFVGGPGDHQTAPN